MLHNKRPDLAEEVWGGCEETTTGIIRLKAMEKEGVLKFPMVAVNACRLQASIWTIDMVLSTGGLGGSGNA